MLKETFVCLLQKYTTDTTLIESYWRELETAYTQKNRAYHTLTHLNAMLHELATIKDDFQDYDIVLLSLYYHDIVYDVLKNNNEEQSAELAQKRLSLISTPDSIINQCYAQIIATKKHELSPNPDTNYFTDTDLAILGQNWDIYLEYTRQIRQEYYIYPNLLYIPGRKKVLKHFLAMNRIFKTDYFFDRFESKARQNLLKELELL